MSGASLSIDALAMALTDTLGLLKGDIGGPAQFHGIIAEGEALLAMWEDGHSATPSSGCVFYDLNIPCRSAECELCASRQATREEALRRMAELDEELGLYDDAPAQLEGWQEPLRQMEG